MIGKSRVLAALAAGLGLASLFAPGEAVGTPAPARRSASAASHWKGRTPKGFRRHNPAGSKLARKAREGVLTLST